MISGTRIAAVAVALASFACGSSQSQPEQQPPPQGYQQQPPPPGYQQQPPPPGYQQPPPAETAPPPAAQPTAPPDTTAPPAGSQTPTAIPGVMKNPDGTCSVTPPGGQPFTGPCPPGI